MTQDRRDQEELAVGYALGALDPTERQAFESHVHSCASCAGLVSRVLSMMD